MSPALKSSVRFDVLPRFCDHCGADYLEYGELQIWDLELSDVIKKTKTAQPVIHICCEACGWDRNIPYILKCGAVVVGGEETPLTN